MTNVASKLDMVASQVTTYTLHLNAQQAATLSKACEVLARDITKDKSPSLPGDKYGRLTLLHEVKGQECRPSKRKWLVRCDCKDGTEKEVSLDNMRGGTTSSCGCMQREAAAAAKTTHGMTEHPIYVVWTNMVQRCTNPSAHSFERYGGRGITVCDAWKTFDVFYADMGDGYAKGLQIDRIDNSKGYEPENCRWATRTENGRNKRNNRLVGYQGGNITLSEACVIAGMKYDNVCSRIRRGWPISRALGAQFDNPKQGVANV